MSPQPALRWARRGWPWLRDFLPRPATKERGPRGAKRFLLLGHLTRGGLGKPLGRGEGILPACHPKVLAVTLACLIGGLLTTRAADDWRTPLGRMPLGTPVTRLDATNCVTVMLNALQSNNVVKALIFLPGATDEFYMFHRAQARLTNGSPTLLDAVTALTNQTLIRATFRSPFLLLHSDEDPLEPLAVINHPATADRLRKARFPLHVVYNDRDWDFLFPIITRACDVFLYPARYTRDSWHFYRHNLAGWNLTGWEGLEAISLAGKTTFRVESREVRFAGDDRVRAVPKLTPLTR